MPSQRQASASAPNLVKVEEGGPSLVDLTRLACELGSDAWRAISDPAQVVASYLACHPNVAEVRYPGLKSDPDFSRAATTLHGGFGPVVDLRREGESTWLRLTCDATDAKAQVMALEKLLTTTK